jgi:hypothetical protein
MSVAGPPKAAQLHSASGGSAAAIVASVGARMRTAGEAKARGRPREQGAAKERSSRLQARAAADPQAQRVDAYGAEAARRRAIEPSAVGPASRSSSTAEEADQ